MAHSLPRILNVEGPGANGLRGGIKQYSPKTTTGPWLDTYGGPVGYKRGFTTADFETEAQHAQIGAIANPPGRFGAGIALVDDRDKYGNDTKAGNDPNQWKSNATLTHPDFGDALKKDPLDYALLKPRMSREDLKKYRKEWTCDSEVNRNLRFQTESRIAANQVAGKFATTCLRSLPGTPKSVETYRDRVIERFGIFALSALRHYFGMEGMSSGEFRQKFRDLGVEIKAYELSQLLAYITPSTTGLSSREMESFFLLMKGQIEGFSAQAVSNLYFNIAKTASEGTTISVDTLVSAIDTQTYPEIADGFRMFLPAYTMDQGAVTVEELVEIFDDMYSSNFRSTQQLLSSAWTI
mmetsp:Transcript_8513/g.14129  ORF Transcript_8513/g.14129 Transcript_8513/m.14129 type:complete len:352 (+) Transcript_8513:43-1098(+)